MSQKIYYLMPYGVVKMKNGLYKIFDRRYHVIQSGVRITGMKRFAKNRLLHGWEDGQQIYLYHDGTPIADRIKIQSDFSTLICEPGEKIYVEKWDE